MTRIFSGVAFYEDGAWQALCLDLDIAAQGKTFEEAEDSLREAIWLYLEHAMTQPPAERKEMLSRKAPLHVRIKWGLRLAFAAIFDQNRRPEHGSFGVSVPCHA